MTFHTNTQHHPVGRSRADVWQFRVAFAATFLVMLVQTVVSRMLLTKCGENESVGPHQSILREARARTEQMVPFMFMG